MKNHKLHDMPTVDHRTPLSMDGEPYGDNVVVACWECNHRKGPLDEATFRALGNDFQARKAAVRAAHNAAERRLPRKIFDAGEWVASKQRLWNRINDRIDVMRGDLSIRAWFAGLS